MKWLIQSLFRPLGYQIHDMRKFGREPWRDLEILLQSVSAPMCFDVGAHRGETVKNFCEHFPGTTIHAFEPDPDNFAALTSATKGLPHVHRHSLALGDAPTEAKLQKTAFSMSNSLLSVAKTLHSAAHQKIGEVNVSVTTLDLFCQQQRIETIDLLKTDCQGFDLRVLRGGHGLLSKGNVRIIQCESMFTAEYEGQGWFYEILQYLTGLNYVPVSFGEPARNERHEILWSDVIFKRREADA